jgi:hypothetical protein
MKQARPKPGKIAGSTHRVGGRGRLARVLSASAVLSASVFWQASAQEPSFVDRLVLDPQETCSGGTPEPGDIVALALRGAKGRNYAIVGGNEVARLAMRGPATTAYSVFEITDTAVENTVAIRSLGHVKFLSVDSEARVQARAEPQQAVPFIFEETDNGYFRIRLHARPIWLSMNQNGYLDFRGRDAGSAAQFCAQPVTSD